MSKASEAIKQAWAQAQTNAEAVENLKAAMDRDPDLYREIMDPHVENAARAAITRAKLSERTYLWTRPAAPDNRVKALTRSNAVTLLDMRLTNGQRLGDADKASVTAEAEYYQIATRNMAAKASFFDAIAQRLKPGQTVRQALSPPELEEIKNAA